MERKSFFGPFASPLLHFRQQLFAIKKSATQREFKFETSINGVHHKNLVTWENQP